METPPNARQVTQDAEQAARDVHWQTSIEDFRRLVATAEETVASARETARAADAAHHRVISTCYLGEYAVAYVTGAHLRCLSAAAALAAQDTQNAALAAQQAYDMVTAACAHQTQPPTPALDPYARATEMETLVVRKARRAVVEADHAVQVAYRAVHDAERNTLSVQGAMRGAEYAARLAAIAADYVRHAARVMQSRYETDARQTDERPAAEAGGSSPHPLPAGLPIGRGYHG